MGTFAILASVLSIVIGAVSTIVTNSQNKELAENQLANQQEFAHNEAELANERYLDNYWATMSPQSKVQQYKDAGLSVGLMYGGAGAGGVSTGAQAQTPGSTVPVMQNPLSNGINDLFQNLKTMSESENISEDTEKKKQEVENLKSIVEVNTATIEQIAAQNNLTNVMTMNAKLDGILKQIDIDIQDATKTNQIESVATNLQNLKIEGGKLLQELEGLNIDNTNKQQMYNATVNKMAAETALAWKNGAKAAAETNLAKMQEFATAEQGEKSYAERQKIWTEINNYQTVMAKIEAEIKLIEAETKKTGAETVNVKMDRVGKVIGWIESLSRTGLNSAQAASIK